MFLSSINFGITPSFYFLYSVGYKSIMVLDTLNIVPFFMYLTITPLTLLPFDGFILSTAPMVHCALGFLSSCISAKSPT